MLSLSLVELSIVELVKLFTNHFCVVWEPDGNDASCYRALSNLVEQINRDGLHTGHNDAPSLDSLIDQLRTRIRSAIKDMEARNLSKAEKQRNLLKAAEAMKVTYYHIHEGSHFKDTDRLKATCAWEAAKYYSLAMMPEYRVWRQDVQRYQETFTFWITESLRHDTSYVQSKYRKTKRQNYIKELLSDNRTLLLWLSGASTEAPSSVGELTPLTHRADEPITGPSELSIYDADFHHSHSYHYDFAKRFLAQHQWQDAMTAIDNAIWLMPRVTYRQRRIEILEGCAGVLRSRNPAFSQELLRRADIERKSLKAEGF